MTTTAWLLAAAIAVVVLPRLRGPARVSLRKEGSLRRSTMRAVAPTAARAAFVLWLSDVTDGYAFGPFAFLGDLPGGTVWTTALSLTGMLAGADVLALAHRITGRSD